MMSASGSLAGPGNDEDALPTNHNTKLSKFENALYGPDGVKTAMESTNSTLELWRPIVNKVRLAKLDDLKATVDKQEDRITNSESDLADYKAAEEQAKEDTRTSIRSLTQRMTTLEASFQKLTTEVQVGPGAAGHLEPRYAQ
ncbi:hypothetical protein PG994_003779 [Apiospora phragmitis]|uniref:Uncharacterized protein n=1 Tax=Apiospora phragmitis TaxID=2905665 RepID=A0ABR1W0C4_9PEZI